MPHHHIFSSGAHQAITSLTPPRISHHVAPFDAPAGSLTVPAVIEYTFRGDVNISEIVQAILARAHNSSWVVCLKALVLAHAVMRGGHEVALPHACFSCIGAAIHPALHPSRFTQHF
jgi:hypothetical protein